MLEHRKMEVTFIGRTYMMFLYVMATLFLLMLLATVLNNVGTKPNWYYNLYISLGLWTTFVVAGIIYEWHRLAFKRLGMQRQSVRILRPLFFMLIMGILIILTSALPFEPFIRAFFSIIIILLVLLMWKTLYWVIREKLATYREREF